MYWKLFTSSSNCTETYSNICVKFHALFTSAFPLFLDYIGECMAKQFYWSCGRQFQETCSLLGGGGSCIQWDHTKWPQAWCEASKKPLVQNYKEGFLVQWMLQSNGRYLSKWPLWWSVNESGPWFVPHQIQAPLHLCSLVEGCLWQSKVEYTHCSGRPRHKEVDSRARCQQGSSKCAPNWLQES